MQREEMKESLIDRLTELLQQEPKPRSAMVECDRLAEKTGYLTRSPDHSSPEAFSRDLIEGMRVMVDQAMEQEYDPQTAESAEDLVLRLLPSDGHLD